MMSHNPPLWLMHIPFLMSAVVAIAHAIWAEDRARRRLRARTRLRTRLGASLRARLRTRLRARVMRRLGT
jgi:hypothetical protein